MKKSLKRTKKSRKTARIRRRPKRLKRLSRGRGGIVSSKKKTKRKHRRKLKGGMNEEVTVVVFDLFKMSKMINGMGDDKLTFDFANNTVRLHYPREGSTVTKNGTKTYIPHKSVVYLDQGYLVECNYQIDHGGFNEPTGNDWLKKYKTIETFFNTDNSYIVRTKDKNHLVIDCGNNIKKRNVRELFLKLPINKEQIRLLTVRKKLILTRGLLETTSSLKTLNFDQPILILFSEP